MSEPKLTYRKAKDICARLEGALLQLYPQLQWVGVIDLKPGRPKDGSALALNFDSPQAVRDFDMSAAPILNGLPLATFVQGKIFELRS